MGIYCISKLMCNQPSDESRLVCTREPSLNEDCNLRSLINLTEGNYPDAPGSDTFI